MVAVGIDVSKGKSTVAIVGEGNVSSDEVLAAYNYLLALAETDENILEVRLHPDGTRIIVAVTEEVAMERSREYIRQLSEQFGAFVIIVTGDIDNMINDMIEWGEPSAMPELGGSQNW